MRSRAERPPASSVRPPTRVGRAVTPFSGAARFVPGLAVATAVGVAALLVGELAPTVGAPVLALVGGMIVATTRRPMESLEAGVSFAAKRVLQASIVLLGLNLSLSQVIDSGRGSALVLLATLGAAWAAACGVSRLLRLRGDLPLLIGVGTAICGASAIAAASSAIGARGRDVTYAMTTIFVFNAIAVLTFPAAGHLIDMSEHAFGVWAGTSVNDTSSVVGVAAVFGDTAFSTAVVVKLTRTLTIIPICIALGARQARRARRDGRGIGRMMFAPLPTFVLLFVLSVAANSAGVVPTGSRDAVRALATFTITVALAAIGLTTRVAEVRSAGARPLLLGAAVWSAVALTSLATQALTGSLR